MIFLQICRIWRSIALATPALWTGLCFCEGDQAGLKVPEKFEEFITSWFRRAHALPLCFIFFETPGEPVSDMNAIIHRHATHLSDLRLHISEPYFDTFCGGTFFPVLRNLELGCVDFIISDGPPIYTFLLAPQLCSLSLHAILPSTLALPWEQLTKCSVNDIGVAESFDLLRRIPSLREFESFGDSTQDSDQGLLPIPVTHNLISLLIWHSGNIIPYLCSKI